MFRIIKHYANNAFCAKYNPLSAAIHHDDILRFQHMFADENESMVAFPLRAYDKTDWTLAYVDFILPADLSKRITSLCKREKCRISPLLQYVTNAAVIESHEELTGDFYRAIVGNTFSTIPMYEQPKNVH